MDDEELNLADQIKNDATEEARQEKSNIARTGEDLAKKTIQQATKNGVQKKVISQAITSALGPLIPYIGVAIAAILIIIAIIGIIGFVVTLPGLMKDKLKAFSTGISDWWKMLYQNESVVNIKDEDVVELGNYIEQMGYDLIGFGFITPKDNKGTIYTSESLEAEGYSLDSEAEANGKIQYKDKDGNLFEGTFVYKDGNNYNGLTGEVMESVKYKDADGNEMGGIGSDYTKNGIRYNSEGQITSFEEVDSSLLRKYAISNNRIYVIRNADKNNNVVKWLHDVFFGGDEEATSRWSKGLISLYDSENFKATKEYESTLGESIKIKDNNKMVIKSWGNNPMDFNIEGWTGRYGLSQDFLISLHIATLSPELVETLVREFDTEVQVYLDKITNNGKDKNSDEISWAEVKMIDTLSKTIGLTDDQDISDAGVGLTIADFHEDDGKVKGAGININDEGFDIASWWISSEKAMKFIYLSEIAGSTYCTNGYKAGIENHVLPEGDVNGFTGGFDDGLNIIDDLNGKDGYIAKNVPNYILDVDSLYPDSIKKYESLNTVSYNMAQVMKQFVDQLDGRYGFSKEDFYKRLELNEDWKDEDNCSIDNLVTKGNNPYDVIDFLGTGDTVYGIDTGYYGLTYTLKEDAIIDDKINYNFFVESAPENTTLSDYIDPYYVEEDGTFGFLHKNSTDLEDSLLLSNMGSVCAYEFSKYLGTAGDHHNMFGCTCKFCTNFWYKWVKCFQVDWGLGDVFVDYDPEVIQQAMQEDNINVMTASDLYSWFYEYENETTGEIEELEYHITFYFPYANPKNGKVCVTRAWSKEEARIIQGLKEEVNTCSEKILYKKSEDYDYDKEYSEKELKEMADDLYKFMSKDKSDGTGGFKVCSQCKTYIHGMIKSLLKINDNNFETYVPYIARVVNSWFRDTYFVIPENKDIAIQNAERDYNERYNNNNKLYGNDIAIIQNDSEFLEYTGELWTKYVKDNKGNYAVFWINSDGNFFKNDSEIDDFLDKLQSTKGLTDEERQIIENDKFLSKSYSYVDSSAGTINTYAQWKAETDEDFQTAEEEKANNILKKYNISLVKWPITQKVNKLDDGGEKISGIAWNAYGLSPDLGSVKWQFIDADDDTSLYIRKTYSDYDGDRKNGDLQFWVGLHNVFDITQLRDAQRGITSAKVKYLFKNRKYYKYDGSVQTAYNIYNDWLECKQIFKNNEKELNKVLDDWYYDNSVSTSYKFARDFDNDGIADIASPNINSETYNDSVTGKSLNIDVDKTTKTYDPRDPSLIDNIDLTLESLAAFSILENTPSADAEYAYRDLKELLVELDYFDKEDLVEPAKDVLEWLLPNSGSAGYPYRTFDKTNDYGTLIHSKDMYDELNEIAIEGVTMNVVDGPIETEGNDSSETSTTTDTSTSNSSSKIKEDDKLLSLARNISSRSTDNITTISPQEKAVDGMYYCKVEITVNGATYKTFKQYAFPEEEKFPATYGGDINGNKTMAEASCGICATAALLTGYGYSDETPLTIRDKLVSNNDTFGQSLESISTILNKYYNISSKVVHSSSTNTEDAVKDIRDAFSEGKPVILDVGYRNGNKNKHDWTNSGGHFILAIGEEELSNDTYKYAVDLVDSGFGPDHQPDGNLPDFTTYGNGVSRHKNSTDALKDLIENYVLSYSDYGYLIPDCSMDDVGIEEYYEEIPKFEGFEKGEPIVTPATARVIEIGTVTVDNESQETILDTYFVADDTTEENTSESSSTSSSSTSSSTGGNDEDSSNAKKTVVTKEQYETISNLAKEKQEDVESPFGKSYTTGYVKLEIIGAETIARFEQLMKDNVIPEAYYNGMNTFYEEYYNKASNKSVCDSYTIYIEGIDLTGDLEEDGSVLNDDLSNTILAKLFEENSDGASFTGTDFVATNDVGNSNTTNTSTSDTTSNSDTDTNTDTDSDTVDVQSLIASLDLNYYTEKEAPIYYTTNAKNKIKSKEQQKASLPSIIKLDKADGTGVNNGAIYLKAGTILGVAGNSNIKVIMKNKENAVVENVEEYLEIENLYQAGEGSDSNTSFTEDVYNFWFVPYEGGRLDIGAWNGQTWSGKQGLECGIGIIQWTTLQSGMNNVSDILCKKLYDLDPSFCAGVQQFISWSAMDVLNDVAKAPAGEYLGSQIKEAFHSMDQKDHEKLLNYEAKLAWDGYFDENEKDADGNSVSWIKTRSASLKGTWISLHAFLPSNGWGQCISENKTDEENIIALYKLACNTPSTAGDLTPRWDSQAKLAIDILKNKLTKEQVYEFMNTGKITNPPDGAKYGQGQNSGFLKNY